MGSYTMGALNIQQREAGTGPVDQLHGAQDAPRRPGELRHRRDAAEQGRERPHYNRVAGVDANFRFGFLNVDGYAVRTFSPSAAIPARGRTSSARGHANYQSRTWQFRGFYNVIGERFNDEMGFVPRAGVNNALLFVGRAFRPDWLSRIGIRETRPHWQMEIFERRDGLGLESRYQDWHLPFNFHDGGFLEIGVNPNIEEVRVPFTINNALGVRVDPGRYEFNEWFFLWRTNTPPRLSFETRYSIGDFYDGDRRGYTFGPAFRVNEHFNASVNLQFNDIEVSNGAFVRSWCRAASTTTSTRSVRQRAGAVQHRLAAAQLEPAVEHHPPPAQRHFPRVQRAP